MIEKVIDEIAEAEKRADEIIHNAAAEAKNEAMSAHTEAETLMKELSGETKRLVGEILSRAEAEAEQSAEAVMHEAVVAAEKMTKQAEKNVQRAVEQIADIVVKRR